MLNIGQAQMVVPVVKIFDTLDEALDFQVEGVDSIFIPTGR